ncbi:MAG: carboxylesterase family protein [Fimbriimonadaceae bacterium]|nr:carboxylesterase family protein [Chitinophagales bacterium]
MKFVLFPLFFLIISNIYSQNYCIDNRFSEKDYFKVYETEKSSTISYGLADIWYNNIAEPNYNTFDIAFPIPSEDPLNKKPLVILVHGGGFLSGDKANLGDDIIEFAKRGYVAVSLNYRLGWDGGIQPSTCTGDPESLARAEYMATQDVKAALRYLVENAGEYEIDTAQIFIGGFSAGGMAVLNSVFTSQSEYDALHPWLKNELGGLDNSTNDIKVNYSIKGVLNMWGAIVDIDHITASEKIPVASFYGTEDQIIPAESGHIYGCTDNNYEIISGSVGITNKLQELGICYQLHTNTGGTHEAYEMEYLIPVISCFIKNILCENCTSGYFTYAEPECSEIATDINEPGLLEIIQLYPNPATDHFIIHINDAEEAIIKMFNLLGEEVFIDLQSIAEGYFVNVSHLPNSMYILQIKMGLLVTDQKITILH